MKALIIGGGIGGLTAAIGLDKVGIDAQIYERAAALGEVGAGISLWANAMHALDELGLGQTIRAHALREMFGEVRTWHGTILSAATSEDLKARYGVSVSMIHRADLLALLMSALDPDRIHLDHECTGVEQNTAGVTARFSSGGTERGDLLIGADGLDSVVRSQIFGAVPPRYAGYTAWRAVADFTRPRMVASESWGRGRRFGAIPMNDHRVYWYATENAPEGQHDSPQRTKQKLLESFRGWHEPIEELIGATDESAILRNDIFDRDPLSRWSENRVTLLGDAAHPMTPNLGQGACQAMEDAVVLAACLGLSSSVDSALRAYEQRRIPRTSRIVMASRLIGQLAQWENPVLCFVRNALLRAAPKATTSLQLRSLAAYEALTEAERAFLAGEKQHANTAGP